MHMDLSVEEVRRLLTLTGSYLEVSGADTLTLVHDGLDVAVLRMFVTDDGGRMYRLSPISEK